jgi:hypothetical protein
MSFSLPPPAGFPKDASPLHYSMPVRTERILQLLKERQRGWADSDRLQEKADRLAWRQLLLWTRAQLAMIETGMAEPAEVLLPYCQGEAGQTLYQFFMVHGPKMLASPKA